MADGASKVYKLNKYNFFNFPKKISRRDYDTARNQFVSSLRGLKSVKCIVEFGTVTAPGVSDLDFMVIIDDKHKIPIRKIKRTISQGKIKGFVKDGTVLSLTTKTFKNIRFIDNFGKFKFLFGNKIKTYKPSKKYQQGLDLVCLIDWLPERLMRLNKLLKSPNIDVINSLCLLHSTKYSLNNMNNKYNLQKNRQLNFSKNVEKLRKKWNELPNATSLLLKTLKLGIELLADAIDKLSEVYYFQEISSIKKDLKLPLIKQLSLHKSINLKFNKSFKNKKTKRIFIPQNLSYHFWFLASIDCNLSNLIRRRAGIKQNEKFKDILNIDRPYFIALRKKMNLLNINYNTLLKSKASMGMVRYGNYVNFK